MACNWKIKQFSTPKSPYLNWVFFFFINLLTLTLSDPRIHEAALLCGPTTTATTTSPPPKNFSYIPNFVREMELLSQLVNSTDWGHTAVNSTVIPIYGLAQCHQDLPHTDCLLCFAVARTRLPHCLPAVSGLIYLDGCFLRYDRYDFFEESVDPVRDTVNCTDSGGVGGGVARAPDFNSSVGELIGNFVLYLQVLIVYLNFSEFMLSVNFSFHGRSTQGCYLVTMSKMSNVRNTISDTTFDACGYTYLGLVLNTIASGVCV